MKIDVIDLDTEEKVTVDSSIRHLSEEYIPSMWSGMYSDVSGDEYCFLVGDLLIPLKVILDWVEMNSIVRFNPYGIRREEVWKVLRSFAKRRLDGLINID